jgi:hypothetical protein
VQVVFGVLSVESKITAAFLHRIFDYRARKSESFVFPVNRTDSGTDLYTMRCSLREPDFIENFIYGFVDGLNIGLFQWFVLTPNFARVDWFQVVGEGCLSQRNFGLSSTGSSSHVNTSRLADSYRRFIPTKNGKTHFDRTKSWIQSIIFYSMH